MILNGIYVHLNTRETQVKRHFVTYMSFDDICETVRDERIIPGYTSSRVVYNMFLRFDNFSKKVRIFLRTFN